MCVLQVYAALKQRHPQQTTTEQLSGLLADLKVMICAKLPLVLTLYVLHHSLN